MGKEKENERPVKSDNSVEIISGTDDYQGKEFIEPLKKVEDDTLETDIAQASEAGTENESDTQQTDLDSPEELLFESEDSPPESKESQFESEEILPETDVFSEPDALTDPCDEISEKVDDTEKFKAEKKEDSPEEYRDKISTQNETKDTAPTTVTGTEKRKKLSKLTFLVVLMLAFIGVLLAYRNQWSFGSKQNALPPALQSEKTNPVESPGKINATQKHDPYKNYRDMLNEVTELRKTLLLKQQEVKELKEHYAKAIKNLENDILQETLNEKIQNYQQALLNTRIMLGLHTIQRRQAYIHKLDEPINWLEQGSEELLYLRRKAFYDLQIMDIAGGIDMDRHRRQINAGIQKYALTAENLAIDPAGGKAQPLQQIWKKIFARTKNNPHLKAQLHSWFIQQEVCSGDLSRLGELSDISIDTAKCVSDSKGSDIFLNNITLLSPRVAKYLCRWNGKWLCLNGLQTLSPATAQYLFQWKGEWLSLHGLSEFPPDVAKHLAQWNGSQLELMGLKYHENRTDHIALTIMAEWEKAGGKLFVPEPIRNMLKEL